MIEQGILTSVLIITGVALAPGTPPREKCTFDGKHSQEVRRIAAGISTAYYFACQEHNSNSDATSCIKGTVKRGLVVSLNRTAGPWASIFGNDSTSGWVRTSSLTEVGAEPRVPLTIWEGWWQHPPAERVNGLRNDRLLITAGKEPGSLHVSGRAYWFGIGKVVHYGQIIGEARPLGKYLHVVQGSCVLDLQVVSGKHTELQAHQNEFEAGACGGINVTFAGKWVKFTPNGKRAHRVASDHPGFSREDSCRQRVQ